MSTVSVDERYPIPSGSLPQTWAVCMVGDAITDVQSGFASGVHNQAGEGIPHLRPMNVSREGEIDLSVMKYVAPDVNPLRVAAGDVLFNNTNSPELIGKTAAVPASVEEVAFSNHMTRLRPPDELNPKFVARQLHYLWMSGYFQYRCTNHVNQASLSSSTLAKTVPLVVAPLKEQDRIVDEIEKQFTRLDAATAALKRLQANLKRYRASVLKAACEGRLVPTEAELARNEGRDYESGDKLLQCILRERRARWEADTLSKMIASGKPPQDDRWRQKYKEPASPDTRDLPMLPEGWCWTTAEQLSDETRAITYGVIKLGAECTDGIPTLRSSDVRNLYLDRAHIKRISPQIAGDFKRTFLEGGEVLVTVRGTLGGIVCVDADCRGFNISREVAMIAPVEKATGPAIAIFIASPPMQSWLMQNTAGIAYTGVNIERLKQLPLPLAPLAELQRIIDAVARQISAIDNTSEAVRNELTRGARLQQGILAMAFSGNLVGQDPSDEPAFALLDRIRAERSIAANGAANGRKLRNRDETAATPR